MNRAAAFVALLGIAFFLALGIALIRDALDYEPADVLGEIEELYDADH